MRYLVHHMLEAAALSQPDATAVVDGDRCLTYGELDARANQLAHTLIELGVRRGDRVALFIEKSIEALVGVYGTMKAGGAYVPLDVEAPVARSGYITRDAGARVLLSGGQQQHAWDTVCAHAPELQAIVALTDPPEDPPGGSARTVAAGALAAASAESPHRRLIESDLAYILYTSGSTGAPKGVMLSHRNCLAFVQWAAEEFGLSRADRLSSHAPLHFDLSTFDLFAGAVAGATVVLVPPRVSIFPAQVRRFIEQARISVWYSVPSVLTMLVLRGGLEPDSLATLRTVLFAGEVFPTRHLRRLTELLPHVRFANLYGPTETNVCTWWEVALAAEEDDDPIPIGQPIANVDVFALTDEGRRAGPGEVGELHVRGPTVMRGYLGDPERTQERLVENPLDDAPAQTVYRTGDLVSPTAEGLYRFLGRRDEQVKSRGYRIELGEIESALHRHPAVVECAVVAIPDELISNRLEAYVHAREDLSSAQLATFCAEHVPGYMIPAAFHFTGALPRNANGKIDRRSLRHDRR